MAVLATAKWSPPSAISGNLLGTVADGLAASSPTIISASAFFAYDNSAGFDFYASLALTLGAITPTTGASIGLRAFCQQGSFVPDNTASLGGGDAYSEILTTSTGVKKVVFRMVRIYPEVMLFSLINSSGTNLASSGNILTLRTFDEASNS